jgi:hypothetical protein
MTKQDFVNQAGFNGPVNGSAPTYVPLNAQQQMLL